MANYVEHPSASAIFSNRAERKRLKIFTVGKPDWLALLEGKLHFQLPEGSTILETYYDFESQGFSFCVHNSDWEPVPEGHKLPRFTPERIETNAV